jgi:type IV fimbrial biogenesis protein FimT
MKNEALSNRCIRTRGFTVVELMVTVAVVAVLAAIALPNFRDFIRRNNVSTQTSNLFGDLQLARSQAISRRGVVALCPRALTATPGDTTCASSTAVFDNGWLVYTNPVSSASAPYTASSSQSLLHLNESPDAVSIRADTAGTLSFDPRGQLRGNLMHFYVCYKPTPGQTEAGESTARALGRQLTLEASGRASVSDLADGAACD